jgi:hypothetical protein
LAACPASRVHVRPLMLRCPHSAASVSVVASAGSVDSDGGVAERVVGAGGATGADGRVAAGPGVDDARLALAAN